MFFIIDYESCYFCLSTPFLSLLLPSFSACFTYACMYRAYFVKFPPCRLLVSGKPHHLAVIVYSFLGTKQNREVMAASLYFADHVKIYVC